jgi:REP element-mobilizing transposase RayT
LAEYDGQKRSFAPPDSRERLSLRGLCVTFYRRKLPHLQRDNKPHFVTFCTHQRWILPESVRQIVLDCCLHDREIMFELHVAVVMPDHVHLVFTPLMDVGRRQVYSLAEIMDRIKGASAHLVNRKLGRTGKVWQTESFDRVLRTSERLGEKIEYVRNNPVRKGLVGTPDQYPWTWVADPEVGRVVSLKIAT